MFSCVKQNSFKAQSETPPSHNGTELYKTGIKCMAANEKPL